MPGRNRPVSVLMVEDSAFDVRMTERAFHGLPFEFTSVSDGQSAIQTITSRPNDFDLVLLDLNLPRVRGDEVLRQIKLNPMSRRLPVIILTSSDNPDDVERAWEDQCAGFVTKPATPSKLREFAEAASTWWAGHCRLR